MTYTVSGGALNSTQSNPYAQPGHFNKEKPIMVHFSCVIPVDILVR